MGSCLCPCLSALPLLLATIGPVLAQQPPAAPEPKGFWDRDTLLGDAGGVRSSLGQYGISLGLSDTEEVLGNVSGGFARRAAYTGLTQVSLGIDLDKAVGLEGGIFNVSAFQIRGRGLSADTLGTVNAASSIEADRSTRLFELWYQQSFLNGKADIKVGQQQADLEFMISQYAGLFINANFGWPSLPSVDLPSGGPAYPMAAPGIRLRAEPSDTVTALFGIFNGSAGGLGLGDAQQADISGTRFDLDSGVFAIGEVQYALNQGDGAKGLPGTYKFGGWYSSYAGNDPALPPTATHLPRRDIWSLYAVADQAVYRPAGATSGGAGVFARAGVAPGGHNLISAFLNAGVSYQGAFGRDNDTVGLGVFWSRFSDAARAQDVQTFASDGVTPQRSSETVLELTYQCQIAPWWQVQPDFQYVFTPGGGIVYGTPAKKVKDEAVLGMRSTVTF